MLIKPLFSIIIPTFNSEGTISRVLDSILRQTFQNYEVLIIDGQSKDATASIVQMYQLKNEKIQLYSEADKGIYDAMNKGIEHSNGKWLYFMGSDDFFFDENVLMNIQILINDGSYDVIYGNVHSTRYNRPYDGIYSYEKLTKQNICHQAIFIKKTIFVKTGKFDISYKTVADWHHNIKWFYNSHIRNHHIDLTIAEYADGGFSSTNKDLKFLAQKNEILLKYGFFKIPVKTLVPIVTKIVKKNKKENKHLKFLMYGTLLFCLKLKKKLINF